MKEIIEILKNYRYVKKEFFLALILGFAMETLLMFIPQFLKKIVSIIENKEALNMLFYWGGFMFFVVCISLVVYFFFELNMSKIWFFLNEKKNMYYRGKIFELNFKEIANLGTGKLITRLGDGVTAEVDIFYECMNLIVSSIYRGILVVVILYFYIPKLIFVLLFGVVILFLINYYLRRYIEKYSTLQQNSWELDGRLKARLIMENLTIRVFGKQKYELDKINQNLSKISVYGLKVDSAHYLFYKFLELIIRILEIATYLFIGYMIILYNNYTIAYLVMVTTYIWFLWWPIDRTVNSINRINKIWIKYIKLQNFVREPIDIKDGKKKYSYYSGSIEFKDLDFSYSKNKEIFKNLNLEFKSGKKNALIGHSGGGKSTIVKIILRLYDYEKGEVLIDGQDLKKLKIDSLYKHIGYLPQEPAIFDGTIRENLEYALKNGKKYSDKIMIDALKKAQIDDLVKGLEKGLDTEVGEKGIKLSGGEKQRLAIARIFLKNPEIIILDEPTSALDSISESKITKTLNLLMKGKTSIVIAHRLQTVMNSDNIIIIENGQIESQGKHEELIKSSKVYKTLVDLQNGTIIE